MDINQTAVLPRAEVGVRQFMAKVYGWMSLGLFVTGACGAYMASDPHMIANLVHNSILFYGLMIAEFGLVIYLSGWVASMEASTAKFAFLFYAALTGVSTSVIFLIYTNSSIAVTFFVTAGMFGTTSLYGYLTSADLSSLGNMMFMCLIGLILASFANMWLHSAAVSWAITYAGIVIFTGLTAYDTQKIKAMYQAGSDDVETKEAISGALRLYLDFINLFLSLLRLMGRRRD
jgi:FtsH-binding integral membrane protein